jgi:sugar phosphate permease
MSDQRWIRIVPVAAVMYTIAFIDRTNISLALPAISKDLHITSTQAGSIAGIFFWGYIILQVPGGYIAERWSAKWFVTTLLVAWGFFSILCGMSRTWRELWAMRFFLGLAQSGMYPATLILLSHWFPRTERARANACFSLALPVALIISSPLSGWILDRWNWRVMLIAEGVLPFLWLVVWIWGIRDYPRDAPWISQSDQTYLDSLDPANNSEIEASPTESYVSLLLSRKALALCCIQFFVLSGQLGYLFWLPSAIGKASYLNNTSIGLLLIVPYSIGGISLFLNSWHSDKRRERRGHVAAPLALGGTFLITGVLMSNYAPKIAFLLISLAAVGAFAPLGPFWTLPTELFSKRMAGSVTGMVNAVGHMGGYFGPFLVGYLTRRTGNFEYGFATLAAIMLLGSLWPLVLLKPGIKFQVPFETVPSPSKVP